MARRRSSRRRHHGPVNPEPGKPGQRTKGIDWPEPSFIGNMGQQMARLDDEVNVKGTPAKGWIAQYPNLGDPLRFRGASNVFVKPSYLKHGLENVKHIHAGVQDFAGSLSKYFNKPVTVGTNPDDVPVLGKNQFVIDIQGLNSREMFDKVGVAGAGGAANVGLPKGEFKSEIFVASDDDKANDTWWHTGLLHEFGHTMGLRHSHEFKRGTKSNSIMSYMAGESTGKLDSADINYYRETMGYNQPVQSILKRVETLDERLDYPAAVVNPLIAEDSTGFFPQVQGGKSTKTGKRRGRGAKGVR